MHYAIPVTDEEIAKAKVYEVSMNETWPKVEVPYFRIISYRHISIIGAYSQLSAHCLVVINTLY